LLTVTDRKRMRRALSFVLPASGGACALNERNNLKQKDLALCSVRKAWYPRCSGKRELNKHHIERLSNDLASLRVYFLKTATKPYLEARDGIGSGQV